MNVKLDDQYELRTDQMQYIIHYKGKPMFYFSTIEGALKKYRNEKYKVNDCKTLKCLLNHIKRVDNYVVSLLDENKEI